MMDAQNFLNQITEKMPDVKDESRRRIEKLCLCVQRFIEGMQQVTVTATQCADSCLVLSLVLKDIAFGKKDRKSEKFTQMIELSDEWKFLNNEDYLQLDLVLRDV